MPAPFVPTRPIRSPARISNARSLKIGSPEYWRPRPVADKAAIAAALHQNVWPLLESASVKPIIHATFPLADAAEAHRVLESSAHIGKIVLNLGGQ